MYVILTLNIMIPQVLHLYFFAFLAQFTSPVRSYCNSGLQEGSGDQLSCRSDQYLLFTCGVYYGSAWYCSGYRTITSDLNTRCDYQSTCTIRASNDWFGDPCWGGDKVLEYTYVCQDSWTPWRWDCPANCNGENITRIRSCANPKGCTESSLELVSCLLLNCSRDGNWGEWSSCPLSCDGQNISRTRSCDSPSPLNGGKECLGSGEETIDCLIHGCARNGGWSEWSIWSDCPVNCLNQSVTRNRSCANPAPSNNGGWCHGNHTEWTSCVQARCPVDGNWSEWSPWDYCSYTCDGKTTRRTRTCDNPEAVNNGTNCTGESIEIQDCRAIYPGCAVETKPNGISSEEQMYYYIGGGTGGVVLVVIVSVVIIKIYHTQKSAKRLTKVHPFQNGSVGV